MNGLPTQWRVPYSRYYELAPELLDSAGYELLSTSKAAGADILIKKVNSLLVFLQGHPKSYAEALLREYRRDVRRFPLGRTAVFPEVPAGYIDHDVAKALHAFRSQADQRRDPDLMHDLARILRPDKLAGDGHDSASLLIRNWLSFLLMHASRSATRLLDVDDPEPSRARQLVPPVVADLAVSSLSLAQAGG